MPNAQEIIKLEHEFWETMTAGEHEESAKLLAPRAAMVSDMGSMSFTPAEYVKMGQSSQFKIKDWSLTDEEVIFPTPNTAVCMYKVKQTLEKDGISQTTQNVDTSVWAKGRSGLEVHTAHRKPGNDALSVGRAGWLTKGFR